MNKAQHITTNRWMIAAFAALILLSAVLLNTNSAVAGGADEPPIPVGSADTRAEHEQLAKYFEQQAQATTARLGAHQKMLDQYREVEKAFNSLPVGQLSAGGLSRSRHCELLVENTRRNVEAYQGMMQIHRDLAQQSKK